MRKRKRILLILMHEGLEGDVHDLEPGMSTA